MTHGRRLSTMLAALVLALGGALLPSPSAGAALLLDGAATAAGTFTSLPPSRVLDTRTGTGAPKARLAPHGTVTLRVTGTGGVPTTGVAAVVLNLTVTDPTAGGHITAHPAGTTPPTASNLNFTPRQTIANLAVVKVGTGGRITLHNNAAGTTHLIADVAGYYLSGAATAAGTFTSLPPSRVLDTRTGTGAPKARLAPHGTVTLRVTGTGGVPTTGVAAVVLNLTVTDPTAGGHITAHPAGTTPPTASNLNFTPRQTIANLAVVKVGTGGRITLHNNAAGTTHLIADVAGYYLSGAATAAGTFTSLPPSRVLDTRTGTGAPKARLAPHGTVTLRVTGTGGVPTTGVAAVVLNLTVTDPTTGGHITAHPAGTTPPTASNLNFTPRQTIANLAVVKVGTGGRITLHNNAAGTTHLIADVAGYYRADTTPPVP